MLVARVGRTGVTQVVAAYLDHLVVERGMARNTLDSYSRDLRRYVAHLELAGIIDFTQVTAGQVTAFGAALREGDAEHPPLAASSSARALVAVRGLHKFAHADAARRRLVVQLPWDLDAPHGSAGRMTTVARAVPGPQRPRTTGKPKLGRNAPCWCRSGKK